MEQKKVDCKVECVNGCILDEKCPNIEFREAAAQFIEDTSLDKMLEMAEVARMKKLTQPPKWVIPEDL